MFTEQQQSLINQMKAAGYGYAKFASSVEAQGFCTEKQEEALPYERSIHLSKRKLGEGQAELRPIRPRGV